MSDSTYVFVKTTQPLETFVTELGTLLDLPFERKETKKYRLLMVWDLQRFLAKFDSEQS